MRDLKEKCCRSRDCLLVILFMYMKVERVWLEIKAGKLAYLLVAISCSLHMTQSLLLYLSRCSGLTVWGLTLVAVVGRA